ncbi:MAG: hypothetical protein AAFV93_04070 [Chloroflexota bacterium]
MDEPFTGVDTVAAKDIMETLDVLAERGIAILLATHDMQKASENFDKVLLLKSTKIAFGTADTVMTPDILAQAYGGSLRVFNEGQETVMILDEHGGD